jgi:hypothetical protein
MIALVELVEGFDDPARRIQKALAGWIFADISKQGMHRSFRFGARGARLVGADGGGQKFGGVEFGRTGFRKLEVGRPSIRRLNFGRFAWAEGFDQRVHVNSVRPVLE